MTSRLLKEEASRITENLVLCCELTDLCLRLRLAVLKEKWSEEEADRRLWREIIDSKERAWPQNLF